MLLRHTKKFSIFLSLILSKLKMTIYVNYEVIASVARDYLLQFKIDNKALLQCIEAGNDKTLPKRILSRII